MTLPFGDATRAEIKARCATFVQREPDQSSAALKRAAVAIALVEAADGDAALLLTLRAAGLRAHSNQWALPGGR